MSIVTDTILVTSKIDEAMASGVTAAGTTSIGAAAGSTVIVVGNTTITSLGTASQAGVTRRVKFTGTPLLTHSASMKLFGDANIQVIAGDIAIFTSTSTSTWEMYGWARNGAFTNGQIDTDGIANSSITADKLGDAAVTPSKLQTKVAVVTPDDNSTFSATDFVGSGLFTLSATGDRTKTTPTAALIIAQLPGYQVGTAFEVTIVQTGAQTMTLAAGTGVTLVGKTTIGSSTPDSGTWLCVVTSETTVSIYRK